MRANAKRGITAWVALALAAGGCAASERAVPVAGAPGDVAALAGDWSGEYSSAETQRSGSISFQLSAGADSASGSVLMIPRDWRGRRGSTGPGGSATPTQAPQALSIRFVRATAGAVSGSLEPYRDPECDCMVVTRFEGRMKGDTIEGSYSTVRTESREIQTGRWKVTRSSSEK